MGYAEVGTGSQRAGAQRNTAASSSPLTINFPAVTTTGNLTVLGIMLESSGAPNTGTAVKDNNNNNWTRAVVSAADGDNAWVELWYLKNAPSCSSVTITPATAVFISGAIDEFSGGDTTAPSDQTNSNASSGPSATSGNVTTTTDGELYLGVYGTGRAGAGTPTIESGWTAIYNQPADGVNLIALSFIFIIQAQGTYAATWTTGGTPPYAAAIASFKPAASSSGGSLFTDANMAGLGSGGRFFQDRLGG